jgi:dTDP-glucose 4,6-dehydratase
MAILVTGGSGFIGSNFIRAVLTGDPGTSLVNLDKLTYAGNPANLQDIQDTPGYSFIHGDICDTTVVNDIFRTCGIDTVVHFAAESHVDRSITDASVFARTNVLGTQTLLDAAYKYGVERFIHVSTDEVYGSIATGSFTEDDILTPSSPYSASKAGSDLLARSYFITHQLPVIVTRCTNNFGPYQHPEKLIPRFITNLLSGEKVPLYGTGRNVRDWIYVTDHCDAIRHLIGHGRSGEIYNIAGDAERSNGEITRSLLRLLGKDESWISYVPDRPGHDFRYSLDAGKLHRLGWQPRHSFEEALEATVRWYETNPWWWRPLRQ